MHHHVVTFRFKTGVTEAQIQRLTQDLLALAGAVPGVVSYACGRDLGVRENNADFAIAAVFESENALAAYLEHPAHQAIVVTHVPTMVAEKHGVQFTPA